MRLLMKNAKVLTDKEFKRVLTIIAAGRHAERNRIAVLISHYAGLRVGEISHLLISDILNQDGSIVDQYQICPSYTKGKISRRVFINSKLSKELAVYVKHLQNRSSRLSTLTSPLIQSQKGGAFSANSLCQLFGELYSAAGIAGASSHSGRRYFCTKLAHSGISPLLIRSLAGHQNLSTTMLYVDNNDLSKASAVELL